MSQYTLTLVDTSGIQDYIFGTNNLKQNAGASFLVEAVTRGWAIEALPHPHNVSDSDGEAPFDETKRIEDGEIQAEVLYSGGGNVAIIFRNRSEALAFTRRLTQRALLNAPGLRVVVVHEDFDWNTESLGGETGVMRRALDCLAVAKATPRESASILGLGVTAACAFTGQPAIALDDEGRLVSAEVQAKINAERQAHDRLTKLVPFHGYEPAMDFDDFGRTEGESSYIAVVHIDGNGMGKRIQRLGETAPSAEQNREFIRKLRAFSESVRRASLAALRSATELLVANVRDGAIGEVIKLRSDKLPFRPIVFGGDDTTFVCEGRLGLSLAVHYLRHLSETLLSDGVPFHSRAGVAIVKMHYPFARAYALADALCDSAKAYISERQERFGEDGVTALDWHFAHGGAALTLHEIRRREFRVRQGTLLMRPLRISGPEKDWRSWETFQSLVEAFQTGEQWQGRRNKVMALRDALRGGSDAVKFFLRAYSLENLPPISGVPDMAGQGWYDDRCGYFDAIEAMDFVIPLAVEAP